MGNADSKAYVHVSGDLKTESGQDSYGLWVFPSTVDTTSTNGINLISSRFPGSSKGTITDINHFSNHNTNTSISNVYGYRSLINTGAANRYNFYAGGTAPNYFAGVTQHAGGVESIGLIGQSFFSVPNDASGSTDVVGFKFGNSSGTGAYSTGFLITGANDNVQYSNGFHAMEAVGNATVSSKGFLSSLAANGDKNYNFYAEGNAPNYFAGNIQCDGTVTASNITSLTAALTAVKAAASDSSTDLAGLKAALVTALASF